jgi:hypothetical protein
MPKGVRIPRGIDHFNPYITNTNSYLLAGTPTNATRLGVTTDEVTQWTAFVTKWTPLYLLYTDKKGSRTTNVIDRLRGIIKKCVNLDKDNHILDRIAASSNVTITDMETFHIKKGELQKGKHTLLTASMVEPISAKIQALGGGSMLIKCYSSTAKRASIFADADSVQYSFMVGSVSPTSALVTGMTKDLSTKARFKLELGTENTEKHLYIYFRWYSTKYPQHAGPWTSLQTSLIL